MRILGEVCGSGTYDVVFYSVYLRIQETELGDVFISRLGRGDGAEVVLNFVDFEDAGFLKGPFGKLLGKDSICGFCLLAL